MKNVRKHRDIKFVSTMKNVRKHRDIKLVATKQRRNCLIS